MKIKFVSIFKFGWSTATLNPIVSVPSFCAWLLSQLMAELSDCIAETEMYSLQSLKYVLLLCKEKYCLNTPFCDRCIV